MKVLAVGGGSGGHVTPVVAVLREVYALEPDSQIRFWVDHGFYEQAYSQMSELESVRVDRIIAGKYRRYNHMPRWRQLLLPSVVFANLADVFKVAAGSIQSFCKLIAWRPDVVFAKGGFVCLPVGLAARLLNIPIVIHDSDALPGLTNRILSRWARYIGTGTPLENYKYQEDKASYVGIPVDSRFAPAGPEERKAAKQLWQVDYEKPLLVVTGGGLGATRINEAVIDQQYELSTDCSIILITGAAHFDQIRLGQQKRPTSDLKLVKFVDDMPSLLRAADVVVARAGASTLAELAAAEKPTIVIPNERLTGGHQVKNAKMFIDAKAVELVNEVDMVENSAVLTNKVKTLLVDEIASREMAQRFGDFAKPHAAQDMAKLIMAAATGSEV